MPPRKTYATYNRSSDSGERCASQCRCSSCRWAYARAVIFRHGITAFRRGSPRKLRPHRPKYEWNGSEWESGHFEKPPTIVSCVDSK